MLSNVMILSIAQSLKSVSTSLHLERTAVPNAITKRDDKLFRIQVMLLTSLRSPSIVRKTDYGPLSV